MPTSCCAPGCTEGYGSKPSQFSFFTLPKNEEKLKLWRKAIPRDDIELSRKHSICARHFEPEQIIRKKIMKDQQGNVILEVELKYARLTDNAVPTIFPECHSYLSKRTPKRRAQAMRRYLWRNNAKRPSTRAADFPSTNHESQIEEDPVLEMEMPEVRSHASVIKMEDEVPAEFEAVWLPEGGAMVAEVITEPIFGHEIKTEVTVEEELNHEMENDESSYEYLIKREPKLEIVENNIFEENSRFRVSFTDTTDDLKRSSNKIITGVRSLSPKVVVLNTARTLYTCEVCNKYHAHFSALMRHMRSHTGEKPFKCKTCGKCLSTSGSLVTHMRTHTGEKPYKCAVCDKRFAVSSSCVKHCRMHKD